jgi:TatA/E family protein of Tat protein translocase
MFGLGIPEILLLLVVILILFGSKRLPEFASNLKHSYLILKNEIYKNNSNQTRLTKPNKGGLNDV